MNSMITVLVCVIFGGIILIPIINQNNWKEEKKEFLKFVEKASLQELRRSAGSNYHQQSPWHMRVLRERIEQLKNKS